MAPMRLWPLVLAALLLTPLVLHATQGRALATFTVNSTADAVDAAPGDGVCAAANGSCTLRAAVQEANALPGADTVSVPAGVFSIAIGGAGEDAGATGDLDVTGDLTIEGAGADATAVDAAALDRAFDVAGGATVTITRMTLRNGQAGAGDGGAVRNAGALALRNVIVRDSHAHDGGGVSNHGAATISESAIVQNTADAGNGGGLADWETASLTNVTLSGNSADANGGGVWTSGGVHFVNATVVDNSAAGAGGGVYTANGAMQSRNTIVALNHGDNCAGPGGYISNGHNLSDTADCLFVGGVDRQNSDPQLSPLGDSGGPDHTLVHAPLPGSIAIDGGDNIGCPPVDQRGVARPQNGDQSGSATCDIGAFEVGPAPTATSAATASATPTPPRTSTPAATPPGATPTPSGLPAGDATCDGVVNSLDAALLLQYAAALVSPALLEPCRPDANGDGHWNALDAQLVLQYSAGLLSHLPP